MPGTRFHSGALHFKALGTPPGLRPPDSGSRPPGSWDRGTLPWWEKYNPGEKRSSHVRRDADTSNPSVVLRGRVMVTRLG